MRKIIVVIALLIAFTNCKKIEYPTCEINTTEGIIIIELYEDKHFPM